MERGNQRQARACCRVAAHSRPAASDAIYKTLLAMAAIMLWVLLFVGVAALGGCSKPIRHSVAGSQPAAHRQAASYRHVRFIPVLVQASEVRPSLIFAAEPDLTPIPATEFTRADWPTTPGRYDAGQTVDYQEYWYDSQGLNAYTPSYGYRTFTMQRNGMQTGP